MSLTLRKATLDDSELLFRWRNDPDVVAMSATGRAVTEAEHDRWMITTLACEAVQLYVAETNTRTEAWQPVVFTPVGMGRITPVGMGRITKEHEVAVLNYSIAKPFRWRGLGTDLVLLLCDKARELGHDRIQAVARCQNTASLKALLTNGFTIQGDKLLILEK